MLRHALMVFGIAFLLPGCVVDVTEPLSDPDKAEPDKRLLGKWQRGQETERYEIDVVRGNDNAVFGTGIRKNAWVVGPAANFVHRSDNVTACGDQAVSQRTIP